mmetsp:Transcript_15/g.26  ORF Transcript_15/g.26 Transcript_15/m.26 type:complete len:168 (+) Transcript_15:92-595(+)
MKKQTIIIAIVVIISAMLAMVHASFDEEIEAEKYNFEAETVVDALSDTALERLRKTKNRAKIAGHSRTFWCNYCGICIGNPFNKNCVDNCDVCKKFRANPDLQFLPSKYEDNEIEEESENQFIANLVHHAKKAWKPKETFACGRCGLCFISDLFTCGEACGKCSKPF